VTRTRPASSVRPGRLAGPAARASDDLGSINTRQNQMKQNLIEAALIKDVSC